MQTVKAVLEKNVSPSCLQSVHASVITFASITGERHHHPFAQGESKMLRVTQRTGQSGDPESIGLPTPIPMLSLGLLAKDLRPSGVPTACPVAQTSHRARARQVVLETHTNHMTTLSSFGRRCGRGEHSGGGFAWLSCLKTKPLPSWELGQPWVT